MLRHFSDTELLNILGTIWLTRNSALFRVLWYMVVVRRSIKAYTCTSFTA